MMVRRRTHFTACAHWQSASPEFAALHSAAIGSQVLGRKVRRAAILAVVLFTRCGSKMWSPLRNMTVSHRQIGPIAFRTLAVSRFRIGLAIAFMISLRVHLSNAQAFITVETSKRT